MFFFGPEDILDICLDLGFTVQDDDDTALSNSVVTTVINLFGNNLDAAVRKVFNLLLDIKKPTNTVVFCIKQSVLQSSVVGIIRIHRVRLTFPNDRDCVAGDNVCWLVHNIFYTLTVQLC